MKTRKRVFSVLFAMMLLFTMTFSNTVAVNASTDITTAKSISVNSTYTGNIENGSNSEKDYYKFTISQSGYVTINFTNSSPSSSTSEAWKVTLLTNYATETITSSVVKLNDSTVGLTTIGLASGTYYICVESNSTYSVVSTNNYSINAKFTSANNWEKEFNSSTETANVISTNTAYYGTIHNGYDYEKDYYKFTTVSDGYVTVDFTNSNPVSTSKEAWKVTLYGFNSSALTEITSKVITTNNSKVSMTTVGLPVGTYYISVQSIGSYYTVSNDKYAICANFTEADNWEQEFNEDVSASNAIEVNNTYYGTIRNGYDYEKDYYKFETANDGYVTVDFTNSLPTSSTSEAWKVTLYGFSSSALTEITSKVITTNNSKVSMTTVGLPKGIYYVCVQSIGSYYVVSTNKYSLNVNYTSSNNWEKEFNENNTTATSIITQEIYSGTIRKGYDSEKDYYEFKTTSTGTIDITFFNNIASTSTSEAWSMYVYDSSLNLLDSKTIKLNDTSVNIQLTGRAAGTYYICIQSKGSYYVVSDNIYQLKVVGSGIPTWADSTNPTGTITATNNLTTSQTVTLTMADNVGVVSYYWGTSSSPSSSSYTSITSATSKTVTKTVSSAGTYYLIVKDAAGNTTSTSEMFYKTTFNSNGGSVSPSYVITKSGKGFTVPTPTKSDAEFIGWDEGSDGAADYKTGATYNPSKSLTLSAIWEEVVLSSISVYSNPTKTNYYVGDTFSNSGLTIKLIYSDGTTETISTGFTIDGFESESVGTKTITVSYGGKTTTFTVTVEMPTVILSKQSITMDIDETSTISAVTTPSDHAVTWTSSNTSVVTISNGSIVAKGSGTANITAKFTYNGVIYSATCTVRVNEKPVLVGDVNGDGVIDAGDAVLISRYDAGFITLTDEQLTVGDVNGDGVVDAGDAVIISRYDAGFISTLN